MPHRNFTVSLHNGLNTKQKKRETIVSLSQYPEPGSNRHRGEPTGV